MQSITFKERRRKFRAGLCELKNYCSGVSQHMGKLVQSSLGALQQPPSRSALELWREPTTMETALVSTSTAGNAKFFSTAEQKEDVSSINTDDSSLRSNGDWDTVKGLEAQQRAALSKIASKGVVWKHPNKSMSFVLSLHHGGEVEADGNCLFTASQKAMQLHDLSAQQLRLKTVDRFRKDYSAKTAAEQQAIDSMIKNLYNPDLASGWGVHVVQEMKLLAKKADREAMETAIRELEQAGMSRNVAAETVYKERCLSVKNGESWAKYMSVGGNCVDEYDIVTLQYTEEGLLTVDENRDGRAAAFGDDIAIESLASEFEREIFVVQAHGSDAMVDEDNCIFFLPHPPKGEIQQMPVFLFMKGTGWCGAGADHYEPLIAQPLPSVLPEKAHLVL